jgi:flagellar hook assembly protein FlgD
MHLFGLTSVSPTEVPALTGFSGPLRLTVTPNPARQRVAIGFDLPSPDRIAVDVLDVTGRRIRALGGGTALAAGRHGLSWEGRDDMGQPVRSGLYFVRVRGAGTEAVGRVILIR